MNVIAIRRLRRGLLGVCAALGALAFTNGAESTPAPSFAPSHLFVAGYDGGAGSTAIFEFDEAGAFVRTIPAPTGGSHMGDMVFGPDGGLYFVESDSAQAWRVAPALDVTTVISSSAGFISPTGLAFGPQGNLYLACRAGVVAADATSGPVATYTAGTGQQPQGLTLGADGHVYQPAVSPTAAEVVELDAGLRFLRTHRAAGWSAQTLLSNVVVGPDGAFYVGEIDTPTGRIRKFDSNWVDQGAFGEPMSPFRLAFGPDGDLYVADYSGNVFVVDPASGSRVRTIGHAGMSAPAGLAFAPFRFKAKIKGTVVEDVEPGGRLEEPTATLSLAPGSGTILFDIDDAPPVEGRKARNTIANQFARTHALVFHGIGYPSALGTLFFATGRSVAPNRADDGSGSVTLVGRGRRTPATGFFIPASASGQLELDVAGTGLMATFETTGRVP